MGWVDPRHAWMVQLGRKSVHAWRGSPDASGATSPSVEGLPRQGRGEAGKGRGPQVAQQHEGRRAKRGASRARSGHGHYGVFQPHMHAWRGPTDASGGTSPSVEGLPRQGRGEAGKGRGPQVAQQHVGRRAKRGASRARYRKRAAFRQPFFYIWRRGGDSNPRGAINACLISSQVHSTTLPPLRVVPGGPGTRIIRGSEADDKSLRTTR